MNNNVTTAAVPVKIQETGLKLSPMTLTSWGSLGEDFFIAGHKMISKALTVSGEAGICPNKESVFRALQMTQVDKVKVVILGQEPYHDPEITDGLAFSVKSNTKKIPPAAVEIANAVYSSAKGPISGYDFNLDRWAKQGVLLLNTVLTVQKNKPRSHIEIGWQAFTRSIIREVVSRKDKIIFLLWGKDAWLYEDLITRRHPMLTMYHPAYSVINGESWNYKDCFNMTNEILIKHKKTPIQW